MSERPGLPYYAAFLAVGVLVVLATILLWPKPAHSLSLLGRIESDDWDVTGLVALNGDYLYMPVGREGVRVINIDHLPEWEEVTSFSLPQYSGDTYKIVIKGTYAYVGTGSMLAIYDVSNPAQPTLIGTWNERELWDFAVSDNSVYGMAHGYLYVVDVSNPQRSQMVDPLGYSIDFEADNRVLVADNLVLAHSSTTWAIFDASDPLNLRELSRFEVPKSYVLPYTQYTFGVSNENLYINGEIDQFFIYDISDPQKPYQVKHSIFGGLVLVTDDYAFVNTYGQLQMRDVADPTSEDEFASYNLDIGVNEIVLVDNRLFVIDRDGDVTILEVKQD